MWLKLTAPFAAALAVALTAAPTIAQEAAPAASSSRFYSPGQLSNFARATVELEALGSQDPNAQTRVIERSGMSVEDYNSMGDAMRADPRLAASLTPYLDQANAERGARIGHIPSNAGAYAPPRRHVTAARATHGRARHVRAARHRTHAKAQAAKSRHGRHAKATRHAAARHAHATSRRAHVAKKTTRHTASHASARRKHRRG